MRTRLGLGIALMLVLGAGLLWMTWDNAEASHPFVHGKVNRALGVNWYFGGTFWDVTVIDYVGFPAQVKNSEYYPSNAWNDPSFPYLWVTRDNPGSGDMYVDITHRPAGPCSPNFAMRDAHLLVQCRLAVRSQPRRRMD